VCSLAAHLSQVHPAPSALCKRSRARSLSVCHAPNEDQGCIPRDYISFLDHAAERILLRKVGGGYIFVHRMLLGYFASLEEEQRNSESEAAQ
jgi:hypothetical protein